MKLVLSGTFVTLFSLLSLSLSAAPDADLWPRWQARDPQNSHRIDHRAWDSFLAKYLITDDPSGINLVRYRSVKQEDREILKDYLLHLQQIEISRYSPAEQEAFWINLYNARTVELILEHYPVSSITEISFGFFSFGPWDEKLMRVEGEELSLNDIEHHILRPIWRDPRLHYALNCASFGCPNLQREAFTAANMDRLLEQAAREYVNHPRCVRRINGVLRLSKIYDWYEDDFGGSVEGVLKHLQMYAEPKLAASLHAYADKLEYEYDWKLNESISAEI